MTRDGRMLDVQLSSCLYMDEQGEPLGNIVTLRDITERKLADKQRDQQARLLDLSLDAIVVWRSPQQTIEYWNQGAEKLYGYTAGEVYGRPIHEVLKTVFPLSQAEVESKIREQGEWDGRLLHTQKSGGSVAVLSRMQRIAQPEGDIVLEVNRDITSIEEAERAVAEAAAHLKAIVETAVDGIVTIDEQGIIESINPAAGRIFGWAPSEVIGKEIALLMPDLSSHFGTDALASYLRTVDRETIGSGRETRGRTADGRESASTAGS